MAESFAAGASELRVVAARLTATGQVGLKRRMYRNVRVAIEPAVKAIQQSALDTLPHSGGLNEWVADAVYKQSVRASSTGVSASLRMSKPKTAGSRGKKGHDLPKINEGVVRHPVFGNPKVWADTNVQPGFWDKPLNEIKPEIAAACILAAREAAVEAGFR